jgi:uncharacterized protein YjiS (DUF1127 family)
MSYGEISQDTGRTSRVSQFLRSLTGITLTTRRRNRLDVSAMPDDVLDDIGLSHEDRPSDLRDINLMNASIRSGIIFPRPC